MFENFMHYEVDKIFYKRVTSNMTLFVKGCFLLREHTPFFSFLEEGVVILNLIFRFGWLSRYRSNSTIVTDLIGFLTLLTLY